MKHLVIGVFAAVLFVGCPEPVDLMPTVALVRVIATCDTPGDVCEFEHIVENGAKTLGEINVTSMARRSADEAVATDDVEVTIMTDTPIMGYIAGMNNQVFGDEQTLRVTHTEGLDDIEAVYSWKMKIALDENNQYELTMEFFGPPQ